MSNEDTQQETMNLADLDNDNDSQYRSNDEIYAESHKDVGVESYIDQGEDAIEAEMPEVEGYDGDPSYDDLEFHFEQHFSAMLANRARNIEFYIPAYRFGLAYGISDEYESDVLEDALDEMQEMWEAVNPDTWDIFEEPIRQGWNVAYSVTHEMDSDNPLIQGASS